MLDALFADPQNRHESEATPPAGSSPPQDALPLIVGKLAEDNRALLALDRMGYLQVLSAYVRCKAAGKDPFRGFGAEHLWPTMDFVRDWLRAERRRIVARHRCVFLVSLAATLAAALGFVGALTLLG